MSKVWIVILGILLFGANKADSRNFNQAQSQPSEAKPKAKDLVLIGTVTKIYCCPLHASRLRRWAIELHVERVVAGEFSDETLTFAIHSPSRAGLQVTRVYRLEFTKTDAGYVVNEFTVKEMGPKKTVKKELLFSELSNMSTFLMQAGMKLHASIKPLPLSFILSLSQMALPQSSTPQPVMAQFRGVIVDNESKRVPQAQILIESGKQKWRLESNEGGEFKLALPTGEYQITIEKPHFKRGIWTNFRMASGTQISYEFQLSE